MLNENRKNEWKTEEGTGQKSKFDIPYHTIGSIISGFFCMFVLGRLGVYVGIGS